MRNGWLSLTDRVAPSWRNTQLVQNYSFVRIFEEKKKILYMFHVKHNTTFLNLWHPKDKIQYIVSRETKKEKSVKIR